MRLTLTDDRIELISALLHNRNVSVPSFAAFLRRRCGYGNKQYRMGIIKKFSFLKGQWANVDQEWTRQFDLANEREKNKVDTSIEAFKNRLLCDIQNAEAHRFKCRYPYRTGTAKWAGGDNSFYFLFRTEKIYNFSPMITVGSQRMWSRNGKWSGMSYNYTLHVRPSHQWDVIGGLLTVWNRADNNKRVKPCWWGVQGRGMDVTMMTGFLIRDFHSSAKTEKAALRQYLRARWNRIVAARNSRVATESLAHIFVTPEDSLSGGNCAAGTAQFMESKIRPVFGEIGALRADALLRIEDSMFTRRAIRAAASRVGLNVKIKVPLNEYANAMAM